MSNPIVIRIFAGLAACACAAVSQYVLKGSGPLEPTFMGAAGYFAGMALHGLGPAAVPPSPGAPSA